MKQRGLRFGSRQTVKLLILLSVLELVELSQELLNILKRKNPILKYGVLIHMAQYLKNFMRLVSLMKVRFIHI